MNINDGAKRHLPLLGFATFLTYTSFAIGSIIAAQQSFTFQVTGWSHNELIGWDLSGYASHLFI